MVSFLVFLVFFLLMLGGCGRGGSEAQKSEPEPAPAGNLVRLTPGQVQSLGIRTAPAEKAETAEFVTVQGRVAPRSGHSASVIAPFPGRLVTEPGSFPAVGQSVRQGQSLGWVEQLLSATESLQVAERRITLAAEAERARREMEQRGRDLERARKLFDGGVIPQKQLQQAELDYQLARSRHEEAQKAQASYDRLEKETASPRRVELRAPIAGTVLAVNASPGQQVEPSRPIFEIADLSTVWVEARVFEEYLPLARRASRVEIVAPSDPQSRYTGRFVSSTRQETAALLAEARLAAQLAEQAVRREVRVALRRLELAQQALRLVRSRLLPQTEAAARIARTGYDLGELSLQQLILEQRRLVEARGTLIQAGLEAYRAAVDLARAAGG